ncbi:hypothetical protein ERX46_10145 [Brumimicrobium glaciale]|uniref:YARHG domain-containing protein n=1 Tax=Brumimicrobium glaciale TaxID=200475 RepID=A0A4V1WFI3_9FLAO|nr:hypothetical protein [Brumimicrobium glaciale]RYM33296.1 hypothetical protein ERX46_10145 [Brumimicrobium glaciale]
MIKYFLLFLPLLFNCQLFSQDLELTKSVISSKGISKISFKSHNSQPIFEVYDFYGDNVQVEVELFYDERGFLIESKETYILRTDTTSIQKTIYSYKNDSIFMSVTKDLICAEYRDINVWGPDSTCYSNIRFKLYEKEPLTKKSILKLYEADDDLNFYFNHIFFNDATTKQDLGLYLREMKWYSPQQNIHHLSESECAKLLIEIFIVYSFTEEYEDENEFGETVTGNLKGLYDFRKDDYIGNKVFDSNNELNIDLFRSDIQIVSKKKKWSKSLKKNNSISMKLPENYLKLNFQDK